MGEKDRARESGTPALRVQNQQVHYGTEFPDLQLYGVHFFFVVFNRYICAGFAPHTYPLIIINRKTLTDGLFIYFARRYDLRNRRASFGLQRGACRLLLLHYYYYYYYCVSTVVCVMLP